MAVVLSGRTADGAVGEMGEQRAAGETGSRMRRVGSRSKPDARDLAGQIGRTCRSIESQLLVLRRRPAVTSLRLTRPVRGHLTRSTRSTRIPNRVLRTRDAVSVLPGMVREAGETSAPRLSVDSHGRASQRRGLRSIARRERAWSVSRAAKAGPVRWSAPGGTDACSSGVEWVSSPNLHG